MKKWHIRKPPEQAVQNIKRGSDLSLLCARILAGRGFEAVQQVANFLQCDGLSDPFLAADMEVAAELLNRAIDKGTRICIYGDYDCDGIMATVILYSYLQQMGGDVSYRIPERTEGYGLNENAIREMHENGIQLIVTVDNGITAIEESNLIQSLGMTLVITDHHQPLSDLPKAAAIVDLHRTDDESPYRNFCGAGVALKLTAAMEGGETSMVLEQFGELAAIATIADVVELSGENRYLVQTGLQFLANTERPGLLALMEQSGLLGKALTATSVAFGLAPRINASSRFGSPTTAVQLLLSEDSEEATTLAQELDQRNTARKTEEEKILKQIQAQVWEHPEYLQSRVLLFAGRNWHHGVIGIAAARLEERFGKPAILITVEEDIARGSMRSFGEFSAFRCLDSCSKYLTKYGGHPGAGGFSLESKQIDGFRSAVEEYAREMHPIMPIFTLEADGMLYPKDLTIENISSLSVLTPFGEGNETPRFVLSHAIFADALPLSRGKHTKIRVTYGGMALDLLLFRVRPEEVFLKKGDICDFLITAETSQYMGKSKLSLMVQDYRKSGCPQAKYFSALQTYDQLCRGEAVSKAYLQAAIPNREQMVQIYQQVPTKEIAIDELYYNLMHFPKINLCRLRLSLDIFDELGLMQCDRWNDTVHRIQVNQKIDLSQSKILQKLLAQKESVS